MKCDQVYRRSELELININLKLSRSEAEYGCTKTVFYGDTQRLKVNIPAGAVNGQILFVYDEADEPVSIKLKVMKSKNSLLPLWIALLLVLCVHVIMRTVSGDMRRLFSGRRGDELIFDLNDDSFFLAHGNDADYEPFDVDTDRSVAQLIPSFSKRYFLSGMDEDELDTFCTIYSSAKHFSTRCTLPRPITKDELISMLYALQYECPELFQLDLSSGTTYTYDQSTGLITAIDLKFRMSSNDYRQALKECKLVISSLCEQASGLDDSAKEKLVYDYIVNNCSYSMSEPTDSTAYGALVLHHAKCDGFSLALKWVLEEMDMMCICLRGDPVSGNIGHAWNMVFIDDGFYNVDVTADIQNDKNSDFPLYLAYNVSSDLIGKYYTVSDGPEMFRSIPYCRDMSRSYHILNGSYIHKGADASEIIYALLTQSLQHGGRLSVQFESESDRHDFLNKIDKFFERWARANSPGASCDFSYTDVYGVLYIGLSR